MTELLTAAQMRALEQAAMAVGAVTGRDLMERAGRGAVADIGLERLDDAHGRWALAERRQLGSDSFAAYKARFDTRDAYIATFGALGNGKD